MGESNGPLHLKGCNLDTNRTRPGFLKILSPPSPNMGILKNDLASSCFELKIAALLQLKRLMIVWKIGSVLILGKKKLPLRKMNFRNLAYFAFFSSPILADFQQFPNQWCGTLTVRFSAFAQTAKL